MGLSFLLVLVILIWIDWLIDLVCVMWVRISGIGYRSVVTWVRLCRLGYVLGESLYSNAGFDAPERGYSVDAYFEVFVV